MSGDHFQFDENGDTFCCFLVASFTAVLIPLTYLFWPKNEIRESFESMKKRCLCQFCQIKRNSLRSQSRKVHLKQWIIKSAFLLAWGFLFLLVYKLSKIEASGPSFDPFRELGIDRGASQTEIRKAYKKLSLIHHPDRGGSDTRFIRISKAHAALTDETAKKNWEEYGNPDGPEAINFGIALPKWMIKKENNWIVVGVYALVFMFILPLVVCLWWYNSMKFSSTKVLLVTVRLFCASFMQNPFMAMSRLIKLLSSAFEFCSQYNKEIASRPSDNVELYPLIMQIPTFTIFKRAIVGAPYAIKARALIYAHMHRLDLPQKTLLVDKQYIIAQCPRLLEEMINSLLCVLTMASEDRKSGSRKRLPHLLATIENCMLLVPLLVQALPISACPLSQLPHFGPFQLRHFAYGQRNVKTVRQFARMPDEKRRLLLRNLSDEQYRDILNVCASMPNLEISCHCEVIDDEDPSIWPHSLVTVTIHIIRHPLLNLADLASSLPIVNSNNVACAGSSNSAATVSVSGSGAASVVDASTDLRCAKDSSWYIGGDASDSLYGSINNSRGSFVSTENFLGGYDDEDGGFVAPASTPKKPSVPVWDKSKKRGKGAKKGGKGSRGKSCGNQKPGTVAGAKKVAASKNVDTLLNGLVNGGIVNELANAVPMEVNDPSHSIEEDEESVKVTELGTGDDCSEKTTVLPESTVQRFDSDYQRREAARSLESRERCTHTVHCPLFPDDKYEGWWIYLVDRKTRQLITKPVFLASLQTEEDLELKFVAPPFPGQYLYTLCVRSDSYVDFDSFENLPFTVVPLPGHVLQSLRKAEERELESNSDEDEDDDEEEDVDDDSYEDDLEEDEDAGDGEIDMERLSAYVATA